MLFRNDHNDDDDFSGREIIKLCVQQALKPGARGEKIDWEVETAVHSQEQVGHLTRF